MTLIHFGSVYRSKMDQCAAALVCVVLALGCADPVDDSAADVAEPVPVLELGTYVDEVWTELSAGDEVFFEYGVAGGVMMVIGVRVHHLDSPVGFEWTLADDDGGVLLEQKLKAKPWAQPDGGVEYSHFPLWFGQFQRCDDAEHLLGLAAVLTCMAEDLRGRAASVTLPIRIGGVCPGP